MIDKPHPITVNLVSMALDAASMRHQVLSMNIANSTNPSYRPARVSFEDQLAAARDALQAGQAIDNRALFGVSPKMISDLSLTGGQASLDMQTAELAKNTLHYQALLKGLSKHLSIMSTVINEGKR
ncbi:flagellar basal-body rod protein FlgB [Chitinivorax tropicus]|uniref:Flagellar basal body rod protein FlgB n=1 Tax=Chitinivorax tropicus TaxID=714531 RepID=A0A840MPE1_9PROT|nr:flagellar basal body protein [Chitinivorax tropicus]MBB5020310.1 flagellar basal-body rod protein FlgB [Chitinivorax tropicus]